MLKIDWNSFLQVAVAAIGFSLVIVTIFSLGVRFMTNAQIHVKKATKGKAEAVRAEIFNRVAAYALFAVSGLILLYGIYMIIPKKSH